jgi:hypothetical protein
MDEKNEGTTGPVSPETEAVLAELRKEGFDVDGGAPPVVEEPTEEPQAPSQEPPEETKEEYTVNRSQKEPALIPAWEHKVAEKRWEKEREQLQSQIEALSVKPQTTPQEASNLRELAQQYGLVLDESQERFFDALLRKAVPEDVGKKLQALEHDRQVAFLEQQYEQEFAHDVAPLLRERYGEVTEDKLAELKAKLHKTAFTETYAKVPLKKVFLAEQDTFNLERTEPKATVQAGKSGKTRATQVDYDSIDEDAFRRMSPEDVDKYTEYMIQRNGGRRWR